ncbi:hypothetical protein MRX96_046078 [Rhipicephalus microplus]
MIDAGVDARVEAAFYHYLCGGDRHAQPHLQCHLRSNAHFRRVMIQVRPGMLPGFSRNVCCHRGALPSPLEKNPVLERDGSLAVLYTWSYCGEPDIAS